MLLFQVVRVFRTLPRSKQWRSDASQSIEYAIPSFPKVFFSLQAQSFSFLCSGSLSWGTFHPVFLSYPDGGIASFFLVSGGMAIQGFEALSGFYPQADSVESTSPVPLSE